MAERYPDWQARLSVYLRTVVRLPLVYGQHDCALFAAGAVLAMTGDDPAWPFRGRYTTLAGGMRVLRKAGHSDHIDLARRVLAPVAVALAQPGDLAVVPGPEGLSLGVVQGPSVYVLRATGGVGLVPLTDAVEAFAV